MTLTLDQVRPLAKELAEGAPDFVYETDANGACHYERDGKPSCIVGQILHKLGYTVEDLHRFDKAHVGAHHGTDIASLIYHGFVHADRSASYYLGTLQTAQDSQCTWATAFASAERSLEES